MVLCCENIKIFFYGENLMFRMLILLLLFWVPIEAFASPAIIVDGLHHDFGQILQGETLDHVYRFQNTGDEVLTLSNVRSSCGCTAALLSQTRLEPGAVGELKVSFNSAGFKGKIRKNISVNTNDPNHPTVVFDLQGLVAVELAVEPSRINWGRVAVGESLQAELKIVNHSTRLVHLNQPKTTVSGVNVVLAENDLEPGEEAVLRVSAKYPEGKKRLAGYILIESDFANARQLRVPISARLKKD
jgi:hypothetical protein